MKTIFDRAWIPSSGKALVLASLLLAVPVNPGSAAVANEPHTTSSEREITGQTGEDVTRHQNRYQLLRSIGGMLLVLGILLAISLYIRKSVGHPGRRGSRRIQVVERMALDTRRSLVLVQVNGRELLLAVSPQAIAALGEWPGAPTVTSADADPHTQGAPR